MGAGMGADADGEGGARAVLWTHGSPPTRVASNPRAYVQRVMRRVPRETAGEMVTWLYVPKPRASPSCPQVAQAPLIVN